MTFPLMMQGVEVRREYVLGREKSRFLGPEQSSEVERAEEQDDPGKVAEGRAWGQVHTCGLCPKSKEESPELCWGWE